MDDRIVTIRMSVNQARILLDLLRRGATFFSMEKILEEALYKTEGHL